MKKVKTAMTKVNTVLIASGSGTDANAIMQAFSDGLIPNINLTALVSTKRHAGCLEKAKALSIPTMIIDREEVGSTEEFNRLLTIFLDPKVRKLVFLVGCIEKINPIKGIKIYNIHPADPHQFGGKGMYGLKVHEMVIENIEDLISRGRKKIGDKFCTFPTVHEALLEYDSGKPLLRTSVEIPKHLIKAKVKGLLTLTEAAERLQKVVLTYEWLMLPLAVRVAAQQILDAQII